MKRDLDYSVIIPTRNRPAELGRCLAALAELDYPADSFEVLVVDDGSVVPPVPIIAEWSSRLPVRLLTQANAGPATARNHGAGEARGRWLAFLDDDCEAAPGWLLGFANAGADRTEVLGGATKNGLRNCPYASASQILVEYVCRWLEVQTPTLAFFPTNNFAVFAEDFLRVGGFSEEFPLAAAEDREFCYRWLRQGGRLTLVPGAVVRHCHTLTLRSFWRQHLHYGFGADTFDRMLDVNDVGSLARTPGFYLGLLRTVCRSGLGWWAAARTAMLLIMSQTAYWVGFAYEKLRNRGRPATVNRGVEPTRLRS